MKTLEVGDLVEVIKQNYVQEFGNKIFEIKEIRFPHNYIGTAPDGWYDSSLKLLSKKCTECKDHKCPTAEKHPRYWELVN